MPPEIDFSPITDINPSVTDHPGWPALQRKMNGRDYDRVQLVFAWTWFRDGWDADEASQRARATDWWCDAW